MRRSAHDHERKDMPNCNLIVDSCSDLPYELVDREGITLLKFPYIEGGETFDDDLFRSVSAKEFYDGMRKGAEPSTAQLSVPLLQDTFRAAAEAGVPTVYMSFTSGLSGSFDVAMLVRDQILEEFPDFELHVVDTKLASIAEGFIVFEAISLWEKGATARELAEWTEEAHNYVSCEFMVEDLDALKRGGRIPSSVAVAGAALDVKPILTIDLDGKLQLTGVARGRKKAMRHMADFYEKNVNTDGPTRYVFLGNADCPKDMERLKGMIQKVDPDTLFLESSIGPVIGSHTGPGMLAVVFWGDDKRENLSVADRIAKRIKGDK